MTFSEQSVNLLIALEAKYNDADNEAAECIDRYVFLAKKTTQVSKKQCIDFTNFRTRVCAVFLRRKMLQQAQSL